MKVSVIIPCFNAAATIRDQLEALAGQRWSEPWEVILSDNGSKDESKRIALEYIDKLPNFRIIDSPDVQGPAHARNQGALAAKGESLLFCDADDVVGSGWLSAMGDALETHDFVTCRFEYNRLNPPWLAESRICPQQSDVQTYDYPPYLPHAASACIGIKRHLHESIGGFDETMPMLEDTDYCWRLQLGGTRLGFVKDALIHYRMRSSVLKIFRQSRLWGEYNVFLYKKYRSLGMPKLSGKAGAVKTWRLLKRMPRCLFDSKQRPAWIWQFAWQYGRAIGCLKYWVIAL